MTSRNYVTSSLPRMRPLVVVTVGSDHHRFDRLVGWVDEWAKRHVDEVDCVVQHGPASAPVHALGVDYLDHAELQRLMAEATVVVAQGGPMSVVEARRHGRLPLVIPRSAALNEVVDDHQHVFSRRMADSGLAILVTSADELATALDSALADPDSVRVTPDPEHERAVERAVDRFGWVADAAAARSRGRGPTVVMLGGFGRSGSTLLERSLGQVPGVMALGEVLHLWERGHRDDERCGCGERFAACAFWRDVGERAYGGWSKIDAAAAVEDRSDVVRNRHLPGLILGFPSATRRLRRESLLRRLDRLYASAAAQGDVLIDSSKHPAYAYLLRRATVSLRCVLVVRDPRGVAYSWSKVVVRPEVDGGATHMPRYGAASSAIRWSLYGVLFHALTLLRVPVMAVRYEDLVTNPRKTITAVLRFTGIDPSDEQLSHVTESEVSLDPHHTVAGNPMRFQVGSVPLRHDEEWRSSMPRGKRALVSVITAPLRMVYGYRR